MMEPPHFENENLHHWMKDNRLRLSPFLQLLMVNQPDQNTPTWTQVNPSQSILYQVWDTTHQLIIWLTPNEYHFREVQDWYVLDTFQELIQHHQKDPTDSSHSFWKLRIQHLLFQHLITHTQVMSDEVIQTYILSEPRYLDKGVMISMLSSFYRVAIKKTQGRRVWMNPWLMKIIDDK
jgi:hypothetical protein